MNSKKMRKIILLADDDADDTELFCEALTIEKIDVICHYASNGREALRKLDELDVEPQLIFLDLNMPIMNGWESLKKLKEHEVYKHIPVIMYSTSSHQREIDMALASGALCFFTKPSDFLVLRKILGIIVNNLGEGLTEAIRKLDSSESKFLVACSEA